MKKIETNTDDKDKALEQVMAEIEKQFGKGAIMKLGSDSHIEIETTPSGSLALDVALGVGGFPKGRIIEVFGPESSGKTPIALQAVTEVQKKGGRAASSGGGRGGSGFRGEGRGRDRRGGKAGDYV